MEYLINIINFIIHIDTHLEEIIRNYGAYTYAILWVIVFAETGLVFTPFLPGDSLLFAAGAFAAIGSFNIVYLILLLLIAAILGDTINYMIGRYFGKKIIDHPKFPINQKHIYNAQQFYEKHGGKTIFLARFVPILRTFAPFVAGIGKMDYKNFVFYNIIGAIVWVVGFCLLGYFFGNITQVKDNFSLVIIAIIVISIIPIIVELLKAKEK